jgi:hypothetical protein
MRKSRKYIIYVILFVFIILLFVGRKESFVLGKLRQVQNNVQASDGSFSCSPTNCSKNNRTKMTNQCSYITNESTCNVSYSNKSDGMIPCSWINGVYDPVHNVCGKNPNSAGGVCGSCF